MPKAKKPESGKSYITPLPCPFCGGNTSLTHWGDDKWTVGCEKCPTKPMTPHLLNPRAATEAWNTRSE